MNDADGLPEVLLGRVVEERLLARLAAGVGEFVAADVDRREQALLAALLLERAPLRAAAAAGSC